MRLLAYYLFVIMLAVSPISHVSALLFTSSLSEQLLQVPLPHGARVAWTSKNAVHNGSPISIATYESPLSHEQTLQFYQQEWPDENNTSLPGLLESRIGDWFVISRLRDGVNIVVQLDLTRPETSHGFISVVNVKNRSENPAAVQSIPGVELISQTKSTDRDSTALLSIYQSMRSMDSFSKLLLREFQGDGWRLIDMRPLDRIRVISLRRQRWGAMSRIDMVISQEETGSLLVVVSEVSNEK